MGWYWEGNLWLKYWVLHWCNLKCRNAMTLIKTMLDFKLAKMPCFSPDFKPGFTQPNEVISLPNLVWRYFIMLGTNFMFWSKSRLHHRTLIFEVENLCASCSEGTESYTGQTTAVVRAVEIFQDLFFNYSSPIWSKSVFFNLRNLCRDLREDLSNIHWKLKG